MTNGRANGWLRQLGIAAIADELDYPQKGPWTASIRNEYKGYRRELLRYAGSRPLNVTMRDLVDLRQQQRSGRQYIRGLHAAAVSALRRCSETNEPFTLLLRDFDAEALSVRTKKRVRGPVVEYHSAAVISYFGAPQDKLHPLLKALGAEHPVISVFNHESRPLEALPRSQKKDNEGIYFLALSPSNWSSIVPRLAEAATMVLILASEAGPGLQLELQLLDQLAAHDRTVLVMIDNDDDGKDDSRLIAAAFGQDLTAEYQRRRSERKSLLSSSLFGRFSRRTTLKELQAIGLSDLEALAVQPPFDGLLPLTETARPTAPVRDEGRERRISDALLEIEELQGKDNDVNDTVRLLELMFTVGTNYNELRQYGTSAEWMRRALNVVQASPIAASAKTKISLPLRDSLIAALTNSQNWEGARIELASQMENLRTSSKSDRVQAGDDYDQFAQRMWLHIGRMRRESDVPVQDLETELEAWSDARRN